MANIRKLQDIRNALRNIMGNMYPGAIEPVKAVLRRIMEDEGYTSPLDVLHKACVICGCGESPSATDVIMFGPAALEIYEDREREGAQHP